MAADEVPAGVYVATGPLSLPSWFLAALCPYLGKGRGVFWVDAGNRFDAHGASYAARAAAIRFAVPVTLTS